jgi:NAD(P)H-dependent flavin oxidoreductase YrpB (nitropropane dioxygenase family)
MCEVANSGAADEALGMPDITNPAAQIANSNPPTSRDEEEADGVQQPAVHPRIIQGGMGIAVSNWRLARAVSQAGEIGVISGTALDTVLIRRLQDGDPDGHMQRALAAFPLQKMVEPILKRWFKPDGRGEGEAYRLKRMPVISMQREEVELLIVANFVEVYLAKEGHAGFVGINLLEKIQLPTLPSLMGAMIAGVDYVIMGGGIPLAIPGALDALAALRPAELRVHLAEGDGQQAPFLRLDPLEYLPGSGISLKRPQFLAVISSDVLAKTLVRKASGRVDGFVVEHYSAGGHNAPPRREGTYGPRDVCALEKMPELGRPFWLAGGCASPERLREALDLGAAGIQVGTAFACAEESGIHPDIKAEVIDSWLRGELNVQTDFKASPTGYPFKRVDLVVNKSGEEPCRLCDLGYLRHVVLDENGKVGYRCPAGPVDEFIAKGGTEEETEGKRCLCNGLLATIGLGQVHGGVEVPPLLTWGEDMSFLSQLLTDGKKSYRVADLLSYLRGECVA